MDADKHRNEGPRLHEGNNANTGPNAAHASLESDIALARTLQEQEAAFVMLRGEAEVVASDVGHSSEGGSGGLATFGSGSVAGMSDEELAQRLQREERMVHWQHVIAAFTGARGPGSTSLDYSDGEYYSDDPIDPDNMTYEELQALGEAVGTVSKGLPDKIVASLQETTYAAADDSQQEQEQCTICRCEFENGDRVKGLPCSHVFHPDCIIQWLKVSKMCPICNQEVIIQPTDN